MLNTAIILGGSLLGILLLLACVVRTALLAVTVEHTSMLPTLAPGDRVLVWRFWPARWLRPGQIVLVWPWPPPRTALAYWPPPPSTPFVKRIAGLPGQMVSVPLELVPARHRGPAPGAQDAQGRRTWHIPPGALFVRGDNPAGSVDSLIWGPVPLRGVLGVVVMRLPRQAAAAPPPHDPAPVPPGLPIGCPAPPFSAVTLEGQPISQTDFAGRPAVFLFIAPCAPCRAVLGDYATLRCRAERAGVALVLVSDADVGPTQAFVDELGLGGPVVIAPRAHNPFRRDYQVEGLPYYCLVDRQGRVHATGYASRAGGAWAALVAAGGDGPA